MKFNVIFAVVIAALALYIVFSHNGVLKYREMVTIRESYEAKIEEMDEQIDNLSRELAIAKKDKEYLENIIRRDLGLQKKGEDLYLIDKKDKK